MQWILCSVKFRLFIRIVIVYSIRIVELKEYCWVLKKIFDDIYYNVMSTYVIAPFMKADIIAMPKPLPETIKISTNSLFLLKYWATISVLQSRVIPTPIPMGKKKHTDDLNCCDILSLRAES